MVLILLIPLTITVLWLLITRPYCRRNGKGYTTGLNIAATAWVDWQEATEIARAKSDRGMRIICRIYLILNIVFAAAILFAMIHAASSRD